MRAIRFNEGDAVVMRPGYVHRNPHWEGAEGNVVTVWRSLIDYMDVLWTSGPWEGKVKRTPSYMVVPEDRLEEFVAWEESQKEDQSD